MNAFDMISEPLLFAQQLCEHLSRVHQSVESTQSLADALAAQDNERVATLHKQVLQTVEEVDRLKLSLYEQVKHMLFHSTSGPALNQYLTCQDKVAGAAREFADLLVLRGTAIPGELHADLRTLVAQVVKISRRTLSLTEGLSADSQTVCPEGRIPRVLDIVRQIHEENSRTRQLEMEFARRVYNEEKQLDPAAILLLDKCGAALREIADNSERAADCLYLMIRQG